ncbi:Cation efflux system protein CzcB [Luteitalea pratensis]|uniref:Cation efflux system protein CzcB n=1 Tax=Luteitalea pratensis TaxID=1855912 RepID=A0A143PJC0_LUTPR|nr:efflux RND transporter periplasmic adaptor subunit [Luteitalea pratensis]AMY08343.1 Cation efflux system protein CzcB [Luteitalea pratensis]
MTSATCHSLTALVLAVVGLAGCRAPSNEEVTSDATVSVSVDRARLGDIRAVVHASGVVSPSPGAELIVVAPEVARIAEIARGNGDHVRRGDVLVRFELPGAIADVQRQEAEVARAHAALDAAAAAETRAAELFDRGIAARREVEESHRASADARAAIAQATAALGAAQAVAARATVRATFDGIVVRRLHNPGDLVEATATDPILHVIDPHRLEIVAAIPIADASRIRVGAAARASGGVLDAEPVTLKVVAGPGTVDAGTATVPIRVALTGATTAPAGAAVEIDIDAEQHAHAVLVAAAAIVREGEETAVFIATGNKAVRRAVRLGLTDGTNAEILSGVKAGELVVVDGQAGLPDGAAIAVATAADASATSKSKSRPAGARNEAQ